MNKLKCTVYADNNSNHLQQIYTGLTMLHRKGKLKVSMRVGKDARKSTVPFSVQPNILHIELAGKKLCFDTSDSAAIDLEAYALTDHYFKRSFNPSLEPHNYQKNVYPYGLNYLVYPDGFDPFGFKRCALFYSTKEWKKELIKQADFLGKLHFKASVSNIYSPPVFREEPKVLFLARLWDTQSDSYFQISEQQKAQREEINTQRARCIELLRDKFGSRFTGGLIATDFASKQHPELVVDNAGLTTKSNYLHTVKSHDICIASTGLHGSIGWKFGEYVAMSKSIVAERNLNYVPNLSEGNHYLSFTTAQECVDQAIRLDAGTDTRFKMMKENHRYYESNLRPDALLMKCFEQVL